MEVVVQMLNRQLIASILMVAALALANIQLAADGCSKHCGGGGTVDFGARYSEDCTGESCAWVECSNHIAECGYDGNFNDICGTPDWCEGG
jgi:hypothetical protein